MKTIKIITLLVLFGMQAGATGYTHNMFVAHKKLQSGKEVSVGKDKINNKKIRSADKDKYSSHVKQQHPVVSLTKQIANKMSGKVTFNERIPEEGSSSLFQREESVIESDSLVTKMVSVVRSVIYSFIGFSTLSKS